MHPVTVTRKAAERLANGHVWVYADDVADRTDAQPGESVIVKDRSGRTLGTAHYSSTSKITLRILSRRRETIDREFYLQRLQAALDHRGRVVQDTAAYRLCYSEADGIPGLIVDKYAGHLAVQTGTQGTDRDREMILDCLRELVAPESIVMRNDTPSRRRENLPLVVETVYGEAPDEIEFRMNGRTFRADLVHGQKTGVFLDQRENYPAVARYARGRALDCFTCNGGFAIHMASGCETVEAVDSSETALAAARRNAERNRAANVTFREADAFDLLTGYAVTGRRFDMIVLDPPAFAKSRGAVRKAGRAYHEINRRALELLEPGGVLATCSCSHHFSEEMLLKTVKSCAIEQGKSLRVLERRTQSADHPILLNVPETFYLKCLILQVLENR